jgi:hypothetical protein
MNSSVEDLMKLTRRSLGQSKARVKVRPELRSDFSDLSDAAVTCASSAGLTPSCGVLVLDAAAVQRNFDAINLRMENILQDQEHIKQGQRAIMEVLRMRSADI